MNPSLIKEHERSGTCRLQAGTREGEAMSQAGWRSSLSAWLRRTRHDLQSRTGVMALCDQVFQLPEWRHAQFASPGWPLASESLGRRTVLEEVDEHVGFPSRFQV
jgi:hypothetical protein